MHVFKLTTRIIAKILHQLFISRILRWKIYSDVLCCFENWNMLTVNLNWCSLEKNVQWNQEIRFKQCNFYILYFYSTVLLTLLYMKLDIMRLKTVLQDYIVLPDTSAFLFRKPHENIYSFLNMAVPKQILLSDSQQGIQPFSGEIQTFTTGPLVGSRAMPW